MWDLWLTDSGALGSRSAFTCAVACFLNHHFLRQPLSPPGTVHVVAPSWLFSGGLRRRNFLPDARSSTLRDPATQLRPIHVLHARLRGRVFSYSQNPLPRALEPFPRLLPTVHR